MIQPLFNPLRNNTSNQYSNIVTFNYHEIKVQDEFTALSVLPPTVWQSDYYDQLLFELQYYGVTTNILDESDWQNMLETGQIDYNKNVLLSVFTRNSTISELFSLLVKLSPHTQQFHAIKEAYARKNYETIYKDVKRTFKSSEYFKDLQIQDRMTNILVAYANLDTQLVYGQGMNFIVGGLMYLNAGTDEQIFDVLRHIILDKEWRQLYIDGTPGLFLQTARFTYKLKKHLPKLHAHLSSLGLEDLSMCVSPYYLTLFMQNAPIQFSLLILCMYFVEGEEILTKLLISMLHYFQNYLLSLHDFQSATEFIRRGLLINFYREMQLCRKQQRLIKMLIECKLIKVKKQKQQQQQQQQQYQTQKNIIKRMITAPFKVGYNFLFQNR